MLPQEHYKSVQRRLEELAKTNQIKSVLELGCGPGYYMKHLLAQGYDAYGIDACSSKFLPEIRGRLKDGDLTALKDIFGDSVFDLILSHNTLTVDPILWNMLGGNMFDDHTGSGLVLANFKGLLHSPSLNA